MRTFILLVCAMTIGTSATASADDYPRYDRQLEQQMIERLQTKLPEMRSAYGLTQDATIPSEEQPAAVSWMSRIAVDGLKKYSGRIIWL